MDTIYEIADSFCPCPVESMTNIPTKKSYILLHSKSLLIAFPPFTYNDPRCPLIVINQNFTCADIFDWNNEIVHERLCSPQWTSITGNLCFKILDEVRSVCIDDFHFTIFKTMSAVEVFFRTFKFFVNSKTSNISALIEFGQEQILLYAVECPPKSFEVFSTNETFKLIQLFSEIFVKHAVLLRAVTAENAIVSIQVDQPKLTKKKKK